MNSIFHRTSIRQFEETKVEETKIEQLLKAAMAAPSAGNQQPWEYYVVTDTEKLEELSKCSPFAGCVKDAPLAIVTCYKEEIPMPEYAEIDLSASTENLLLQADDMGLGAVWLGIAPLTERMEQVEKVLNMPKGLHAFAIVPCGYPKKVRPQQDRYEEARVHFVK